jgi:hypothetical protein
VRGVAVGTKRAGGEHRRGEHRSRFAAPDIAWKGYSAYRIRVLHEYGVQMTLTVRLDSALETKVDQEAKRLGITKSEFVKDALERVLGIKNPAALLKVVRSRKPMGHPNASTNVSARMRAKLREKRPD